MLKNKSIAFRLTFLILSSCGLLFVLMFLYHYWFTRQLVIDEVERSAEYTALTHANSIESMLLSVQKIPQDMTCYLESAHITKDDINSYIKAVVEKNSEIYGSTVSFEPFAVDSSTKVFGPYYYRKNGRILYSDLASEDYNYLKWHWYQEPKRLGEAIWTEPYFDEGGGNIIMSTYAVPFYKKSAGQKKFMGVVTADLSLNWLKELFSSIKIEQSGYAFLISKNGAFISHPDSSLIMKQTIISIAQATNDTTLEQIGRKMLDGQKGFVHLKKIFNIRDGYLYYTSLPSTGWSLGLIFPSDEFLADVNRLSSTVILLGILGAILLFIVIIIISRSITKPLKIATTAAEAIAIGDIAGAKNITVGYCKEIYEDSVDSNEYHDESNPKKVPRKISSSLKNEAQRLFYALTMMTGKLDSLFGQIQRSEVQIVTSANEINASARQLESTVAEQASSTREVTATTNEISATSEDLANTMDNVGDSVTNTAMLAESGHSNLTHMESEMQGLISATGSISQKLSVINDKANKISSVVVVINKISDQTNLLSLNAAIEAEKAGEYGKGFSVVAREISRLADQTAIATGDIEQMVRGMQASVSSGVMEMDKFSQEVRRGAGEVAMIGEQLSKIIDMVRKLEPQFDSVNQGMQAQTQGAQQISEAMNQLSTVAEQTRDSLTEFKRATEQLNEAVMGLKSEISHFRISG